VTPDTVLPPCAVPSPSSRRPLLARSGGASRALRGPEPGLRRWARPAGVPKNTHRTATIESRPAYFPALDGIRAIAVAAVVAYHLQVPGLGGGLLGVSVFFTLSGYLITSLLLREVAQHGRVDLKAFWVRRARRLLPALSFMLAVVALTTAIARPEKLVATLREALCALLYVANWTTIASGDDYFQRFTGPGPLDHLWSLAIEEQFYLAWPLVVSVLLGLGARTQRGRWPLALVTVLLGAASTWVIVHVYDPNAANNTRAYEGTDCRAAALLIGALAALALPLDRAGTVSRRMRVALDVLGAIGLSGVALSIAGTDEFSSFLYRGGEVVLAASTAFVAMAASHPETFVARALRIAPLRWIGARSYGVYLWHLPVVVFMPETMLASVPVARGVIEVTLIVVLAAASYRLIEEPMRRRAPASRLAMVLLPLATLALCVWPLSCRPPSGSAAMDSAVAPRAVDAEVPVAAATAAVPVASAVGIAPYAADARPPGAPMTSCREVLHVGDSTSLGLVSSYVLPNADDQIGARYRAVGVERFLPEIRGARSMVEMYRDEPNATQVVRRQTASGYAGCFVLALGTNDSANTGGDVERLGARIDAMMALIGPDHPALWTTTRTLHDRGPYQNTHMLSFTQALTQACARHRNMRVYDWASEVKDEWFSKDGIHPGSTGYRERAARMARALARAFPKDGAPPAGCLVGSD
jgi:peptidoglycan/LPS O-acetylase OafA/YrhL/lysophospholipase L1-like esterase